MYAPFFGLKQEPFSIAPDPRYLFMSERHREALAHLLYGVRGGGGFVLLSGEIGAGKTTICRCFLEQIPKRCNVAYIFNPKLTVEELLKSVCDEFRIPCEHVGPGAPSVKDYVDALNAFLLRTHAVGQNNVLIIDEAQNLSASVLEQLRLLTNLETNERKLLQIVLIGQPELRAMLARPELEQLNQRVIARFHLEALSELETEQYIRHRLGVAGIGVAMPFERSAMARIHKLSRGVPRRINLLCDRSLLGAYASGKATVDRRIVDKAASEVFDLQTPSRPGPAGDVAVSTGASAAASTVKRPLALAMAGGAVAGAVLVAALAFTYEAGSRKPAPTVLSAAAKPTAPRRSASAGQTVATVATVTPVPVSSSVAGTAAGAIPSANAVARALAGSAASAAGKGAPTVSAGDVASLPWIRADKDAWRELAESWNLALAEGDPCQAARLAQIQCFRSTGSNLAEIRQLDRPVILTLHDSSRQVYALLTGLSPRTATVRLEGGESRTLSLDLLAGLWHGDFATFWRAPSAYQKRLIEGDAAPLNGWLADRLAQLPGAPASSADAGELKARVAAFQLTQGLKPDGRVGPITLMQLNRAAGIDEPHLHIER